MPKNLILTPRSRRRTIRLKDYDYRACGMYFVTICTCERAPLFGMLENGKMLVNSVGGVAKMMWEALPSRFPGLQVDAFVIMPNHVHGIIVMPGRGPGAMNRAPTLGEIVRVYKAVATRSIRAGSDPGFAWQRNYYEHVIRDEGSLNRIREYIRVNPAWWAKDSENPSAGHANTSPSVGARFIAPNHDNATSGDNNTSPGVGARFIAPKKDTQ